MEQAKQELYEFTHGHAAGISRNLLNIFCFIGVFIFGWLLHLSFVLLGKRKIGLVYVFPILILFNLYRNGTIHPVTFYFWGPIVYLAGWVHVNMLLSRYQSLARKRIEAIEKVPAEQLTIDELMEKGILKARVLRQSDQAMADFSDALQLPGGTPQLLLNVGVQLFEAKNFSCAKKFLERALERTTDNKLKKIITRQKKKAEKRCAPGETCSFG